MLKNEPILAIRGVDRAENEPSTIWPACLPRIPTWVKYTAMLFHLGSRNRHVVECLGSLHELRARAIHHHPAEGRALAEEERATLGGHLQEET